MILEWCDRMISNHTYSTDFDYQTCISPTSQHKKKTRKNVLGELTKKKIEY